MLKEWTVSYAIYIIFILAIIAVTALLIKNIVETEVKNSSKAYQRLLLTNKKYLFSVDIKKKYVFKVSVDTKQKFDRFDFDKFYLNSMIEDPKYFSTIIKTALGNIELKLKYNDEVKSIMLTEKDQTNPSRLPMFIFMPIEKMVFKKSIIKPITHPDFICKLNYTSPKGKNRYEEVWSHSLEDIIQIQNTRIEKEKYQESRSYQRKLMTDSLRYDIMKRDNFKCVICGRSSQDGVTLHVDHILPVSKGGKSIQSNLRTLCESCNMGKSDKYDEGGLN